MAIKKEILEFMNATPFERVKLVRMGFELETQSSDGLMWNDQGDDDEGIDHDAANDAIEEAVNHRFCDDISRSLRALLSESLIDKIKDEIRDDVSENFDYSEYQSKQSAKDTIEGNHRLRNIEIVQDGSVSGFEFRTEGGLTEEQFAKSVEDVFAIPHEIDTGCSFHVHISLPGVQHFYGERMQLAMIEYIAENFARLPENVAKRIKSFKNNQYIKGLISSRDKYSFIHSHSQGTWEFRCFGNVKSEGDAVACRDIAVDALHYAYTVVKGDGKLLLDSVDGDIQETLTYCLSNGFSVSEVLRQRDANIVEGERLESLRALAVSFASDAANNHPDATALNF